MIPHKATMHVQTQPLKFLSDAARMLLANSNLLSAVNNVVTVAQHLLPKCPDTNPFCRSHETERIQLTLRVLASHLEQAAKDPCLAKPVHHAGEALQKLRVTLQKKAEDQEDPEVGKVLEGLDQALAEVQSILADIERRASFVNIALTWGEEEEGTDNPSDETDGIPSVVNGVPTALDDVLTDVLGAVNDLPEELNDLIEEVLEEVPAA